jgi:DNA-binding NarL/FixJ family response regulator
MAEGEPIPLTKEKLRLLQLLANGATSSEAADALGVDLNEVRTRVTTILEKVRASDLPPEPRVPPLRPAN